MHPLVRKTIAEARRRGHEIILDEHFDSIYLLEQAARETQVTGTQEHVDWLNRPIVVGRKRPLYLYPLSFAGKLWLERLELNGWFSNDPTSETIAIAYALHVSQGDDAFTLSGTTERRLRLQLKKWIRRYDAPIRCVSDAARRIMMPDENDSRPATETVKANVQVSDHDAMGFVGQVVARLVHEFGKDFSYWMYSPWHEVEAAMNVLRKDAEEIRKASGKKEARDPDDPSVLAFMRWRKAQDRFLMNLEKPNE